MTTMLRFSAVVATVLLGACVGGTDVFEVSPDGGPIECVRPERPPVLTELVTVLTSPHPDALQGLCVPPPLEVSAEGRVDCQLLERRIDECSTLPGRTRVRDEIDELGVVWHVCELAQVSEADAVGWRHERAVELGSESEVAVNCGMDGERLTFVGLVLGAPSSIEVLCTLPDPRFDNGLGARCGMTGPEEWRDCGVASRVAAAPVPMTCDSATSRCAVPCTTDNECADAGLEGEVCAARGVCVMPGCFAP